MMTDHCNMTEKLLKVILRPYTTTTYTVKPVLSGHSKKRPKLVFKTNYRLMQVKRIAECSKESILQYFLPPLSYHMSLRSLFCLFVSGRLRQVLLYMKTQNTILYQNTIYFKILQSTSLTQSPWDQNFTIELSVVKFLKQEGPVCSPKNDCVRGKHYPAHYPAMNL